MCEQNKQTRKIQLIILAIVVLVGIRCDPMSVELHRVDRVRVMEGLVLLHVDDRATAGVGGIDEEQDFVMLSQDRGDTWRRIDNMPPDWAQLGEDTGVRVRTECTKYSHLICYRIDGHSWIEKSIDAGGTWHIIWRYPYQRLNFTERIWGWDQDYTGLSFDTAPLDFAIYENGSEHTVFFAMGFQGLMVVTPDGEWQRQAILLAKPVPYQITSIKEISDTLEMEKVVLMFIGLICFLYYFMRNIVVQMICCSWKVRFWRIMSLVLLAVCIGVFFWVDHISMARKVQYFYAVGHNPFYSLSLLLFGPNHRLSTSLIMIAVWIIVSFTVCARNKLWSLISLPVYILYSLTVVSLGILPFVFWCLAIIQTYSMALIASIIIVVLMIVIPHPLLLSIPYRAEGRVYLKN
jgi:hypothetical protein